MTRRTFNEIEYNTLRDALRRLLIAKTVPTYTRIYKRSRGKWLSDSYNLFLDLAGDSDYYRQVERAHDNTELRKLLKRYARELHRDGMLVEFDGKLISISSQERQQ